MISFNEIGEPRVPLVYIEFDNSGAVTGTPAMRQRVLMLGQCATDDKGNNTGTGELDKPVRIHSTAQARQLFGRGSMIALMVAEFIADNQEAELYALAQGAGTGKADAGSLTLKGTATEDGVLYVYTGGTRLTVAVSTGQTGADLAPLLVAAIAAKPDLPFTAAVDTGGQGSDATLATVVLTARFTGAASAPDIRLNYYTGETTPAGLAVSTARPAAVAANPDITASVANMGDLQYRTIVMPYLDPASLKVLRDELLTRWGPVHQNDGIAYSVHTGTLGELTAFGQSRNDFLLSCMGVPKPPEPGYLWAASLAAVASQSLATDPARPLQTLALTRRLAPALADRLLWQERNGLLFDGIATCNISEGDVPQIERLITMYRTNSYGDPDPSYLDVNTPATLSYLRYSTRLRIQQRFPRHKLADDGTPIAPGQPIVTPEIIRTELLALFMEWEEAGLVEDFEQFKDELIVERNKNDKNRVDVLAGPNLINQFRIFAEQIRFIL